MDGVEMTVGWEGEFGEEKKGGRDYEH